MLRRQARLRREFLYKKSLEKKKALSNSRKNDLKESLDGIENKALNFNNDNDMDDEYKYAGAEDPKVVITTSRSPSAKLKMFVKEIRLMIPNSQSMNRGHYDIRQLIKACRSNNVTDFIIIHEHRGSPDNMVICHLPNGPTAFFNISMVTMRHDIPGIGCMSEQKPHLVFHNFKTQLGERVVRILKHLYPVPKEESKRLIAFANHNDYIYFRHYNFERLNGELQLTEIGPRFNLKLYELKSGTIDEIKGADTEWVLRPYTNTAVKRKLLSEDDGWEESDTETYA